MKLQENLFRYTTPYKKALRLRSLPDLLLSYVRVLILTATIQDLISQELQILSSRVIK
jgi:hypothetical protein